MFKNKSKKSVAILFSILTICFNVSASNNKISDKKITVQQKKVENYVPWKILLGFGLLGTGIYFAPKLKSLLIKDNKIFVFDLMKNSVDCIKYSEYRARIKATKEIMMAERNEINKGKIDIINDCISISYPEIEAIRECLNKILKKDDQAVKEIVAMREKIEKIDNPLFKTIKDEILDTISLVLEAAERNDVGDHYDNERYAIPNFEVNALPIYETQEIDGKLQFILENNKNEPFVLEIDESDKIIKMSGSVYSYENLSSIIEMALKGKEAKGYNLTIDKDLKFYKCMNINSFKDNIYKKINPKNTTITNGAEIILHNSGKIWVFKSFNNEKIELSCGYSKKNMSGYKAEYALTMEGKTIKINSLCEDDNCEKCGLCEENEENPLIEESINEFLKIKDIEYENPYITDYEVHFIGNDKKELEIRGEYFYDLCSKIGRPQHQSGDKLDNIFTQNVKITQSYDSKKFVTIPYNSKDDYINKSLKFLIGEDKNSYFLLKTGNRIVISYDKSTLKISNKIDPVIKYINTITNYLEIKDIKNFKAIVTCGGDDSINEKLGDSFNDICFNDIYFDDEEEKEEEYEEPDYKEGDNKDYCFRSNDGRWSFVIEKENIDQISFKGQLSTEREVEILFNKIDEKIMDLKDSDEKPDYKNMTLLVDKESNITDMCFKKLRERFGQIPNYETFCLYDKKNENEKIFVEADFFENKKGEKEFIFKFFIGEKVKNKEDISIKSSGNGFSMVDISGEFDSKKVSIKFLLDTIEEKFGINFSKIKKESGIEDPDMYDTDAVKIRRSSKISDNCSIFKELKIEGFTIENGAKISKELLYKSEIDHLVSYLTDQIFDDSVDKESLSIKNIYVNSTKSIDGKTLFDKYSELFAGETTKLQVKHYKDVPSLTDIQMKHL